MAFMLLGASSAFAQTPPTADTTFSNNSGQLWGTAGNWSGGVPTGTSNALIGANQIASHSQAVDGNGVFGTLTLGAGATLRNTISSNQTYMAGSTVYLNNNSVYEVISGSLNSSPAFQIVSGATATVRGSLTMLQSAVSGAGNLNVDLSSNVQWRAAGAGHNGNLTFSAVSGSRQVVTTQFGGASLFSNGTTTFGSNVYLLSNNADNRLNTAANLKTIGASGNANTPKINMQRINTVNSLTVESPGANDSTRPLLRAGSSSTTGRLTVSGTITFQGTSNTVEIDDAMTTPGTNNSLVATNMTFGGTGSGWSIIGDGKISLSSGSIITTNIDTSISNTIVGSNGFTKEGAAALTLTGNLAGLSGAINVSEGELIVEGTLASMSVSTDAELTIGSALTSNDVLSLGAGGLSLEDGAAINWQFSGTGISEYDQIVSAGALDLTGLSNIIINGTNLSGVFDPQIGDVFTLFDGSVTGFDAGIFTLNLPALTNPNAMWTIQEGSLELAVVAVPEPAAALLGSLGFLALLRRRR